MAGLCPSGRQSRWPGEYRRLYMAGRLGSRLSAVERERWPKTEGRIRLGNDGQSGFCHLIRPESPMRTAGELARSALEAYAEDDRDMLEGVLHADFHFSSPLDNRLDRATYFERCWPNHEWISGFNISSLLEGDDSVVVTYDATTTDGRRFKNTELMRIRDGLIAEVDVFFGWSLPHPAPDGGWVEAGEET